ncbi:hypothetical protein [Actinoallomurus soli]|uniref:hypothetical protein n=1 Tax=Actinoallomurus soli TaxID=2952535 RepID=UPI0020939D06|nr:hypothetical protein [Actinoallomurus soli]MCO5967111.1 hypothetical protein [Actinoallomurus soli]
MSRRGNGLTADAYVPLADLTPQLADAMLSALREAGIAAYAAPAPGTTGGYLDVRLPEEPTDRLYADAEARQAAEDILERRLPELRADYAASRDEDEIFAEIVAGFDLPAIDGETPWPAEENLDDGPEDTAGPALEDSGSERTATARVVKPASEDEEEHFVPPPPPPLPKADPMTRFAWIALLGGPVYLVLSVFLGWSVPSWAAFVAVAAFIGGFVALVLRMGDDPPDDDGAVV